MTTHLTVFAPFQLTLRGTSVWRINSLFAHGEQGVWYDPSDLSTLFQDAAGTTPVTAAGQPVGLILDKRLGLVLGRELVTNGTFASNLNGWTFPPAWTWGAAGNATLVGDGTVQSLTQLNVFEVGKTYEVAFDLTISGGSIGFQNNAGTVFTPFAVSGPCKVRWLADTTALIFKRASGSVNATLDNISVRELPGNHARQPTDAARPLFQDVGGLRYLKFDGVDDFLATGNIDLTGTDKVSVFAGVRKLSDAARAMLVELGINQQYSFQLNAPQTSVPYSFASYGSSIAQANAIAGTLQAPISNVLTGIGHISADVSILRVDGSQLAAASTDQGAGNFSNLPLYIGRRGGSSLPFSGNLYGLVIRGALTDAAGIANGEKYLATKSGVTLP